MTVRRRMFRALWMVFFVGILSLQAQPADASSSSRTIVMAIPRDAHVGNHTSMAWGTLLGVLLPVGIVLLIAVTVYGIGYPRLRREIHQRRILERRLGEVAGNLPAVVYQLERQPEGALRFPYVLGAVESLFGMTAEAMMQDERKAFACVVEEDRAGLMAAVEKAAVEFAPFDVEFRVGSPAEPRWLRTHAQPIRTVDGAIVWNGYWVDATAAHEHAAMLMQARNDAERASATRADFLAMMSHEIRTPMSGVLGMLEILADSGLDEQQREKLSMMEHSARILRQLLDDILDYSRIEAGGLPLDVAPIDVAAIGETLRATMEPLAWRKGVELAMRVDPSLAPVLKGDGLRLQQILFNLVGNAIKFTEEGRVELCMDVEADDGATQELLISVHDTGIGVPQEQQATIFQPFRQAEGVTHRRQGGTGLGLSICRHLVAAMGGAIHMDSEPGAGTVVTVSLALPIGTPSEAPRSEPATPPPDGRMGRGRRVLVAEDHVIGQRVVRWRMEQMGFHCTIVDDGLAALNRLEREPFDLLVTDCQMPVMDGYTLARRRRAHEVAHGLPRLPIVALTASAMPAEVDSCREAGMDGVLAKPLDQQQLRDVLAGLLPDTRAGLPAAARLRQGVAPVDPDDLAMEKGALYADILALDAAISSGDAQRLRKAVHRLGGALGALGGNALAEGARSLEESLERETFAAVVAATVRWRDLAAAFIERGSRGAG